MKTPLRIVLALAMLVFLAAFAQGQNKDIKTLMGENFQNLHVLLNDLIISNYTTLADDAAIISAHATQLTKNIPATAVTAEQRELFVAYANTLRVNTQHLITVSQELMKRDRVQTNPGKLNVDYLRVVVAEHFGRMITTCVLCHNQFRRNPM